MEGLTYFLYGAGVTAYICSIIYFFIRVKSDDIKDCLKVSGLILLIGVLMLSPLLLCKSNLADITTSTETYEIACVDGKYLHTDGDNRNLRLYVKEEGNKLTPKFVDDYASIEFSDTCSLKIEHIRKSFLFFCITDEETTIYLQDESKI